MMSFYDLKKKSSYFFPALILENKIRYRIRRRVRTIMFYILVITFFIMISAPFIAELNFFSNKITLWITDYIFILRGIFFLAFIVWLKSYLLEAFYRSYYFAKYDIDFDVAKLVYISDSKDLTEGFLKSNLGRLVMFRLGIPKQYVNDFLKSERHYVTDEEFEIDYNKKTNFISLTDYGTKIYELDDYFKSLLTRFQITKELFVGALEWIDETEWKLRNTERWWSRSSLSRIRSIGRNWSYGKTYEIEKFGHQIISDQTYRNLGEKWRIHSENLVKVENILVKNRGANVSLISPTTEIGLELVASLGRLINTGKCLHSLENKRIFVLDINLLISSNSIRQDFEHNFMKILAQAIRAGNIILIIPRFDSFLDESERLDVDMAAILSEVLESDKMQLITISSTTGFHEIIEPNNDLMQHFEKMVIEDLDINSGLSVLKEKSIYFENKYDIYFTFQSLYAISAAANRFFSTSTYSDKIIDLLEEISSTTSQSGKKMVNIDDVSKLVTTKTGIPQGTISEEERQKLQNLESILHKRVIGQDEAINSIADSMRRARSGITNQNRPIGSFLFIGPTGVGKTETTKALAESFFGDEQKIIRFDMSEYNNDNSSINFLQNLSEKISNQQYGVLLLDELEKTTSKVMDLLLQIIDEGYFTDNRGKKINTRNTIIIATSNADSGLIYKETQKGKNIIDLKQKIIDQIIEEKIFKPELLNRFDGVILFHSLNKDHLRKIAVLMLRKLNNRLSSRGLTIEVTSDLVDYLVESGFDPLFGARSMNRIIQDQVEKIIADGIVSGQLTSGMIIKLVKTENGNLDLYLSDKFWIN